MILDIRPGLHLEIHSVPGSDRIRWNIPQSPPCIFDPTDGSWHPCNGQDPQVILASVPPADLILIELLLQRHSMQRRRDISALNTGAAPLITES